VGGLPPIQYALLADRFGVASFGTVRGLMSPVSAISGMICIWMAGEVFDRTGGYGPLFAGFVAVSVVSVGLMLATRLLAVSAAVMACDEPSYPAPEN
jgi:hypothetical protein